MLTFGATLIILGEILILLCLAILYFELRRNYTAIRQIHVSVNLFMDELLHPKIFEEKKDGEQNQSQS